ncbi:MAG UNVERIFIED_CONTAM: hypothetical protein LVR29_05985 [Microcystis novacekii LVE1205-3]
MADNSNAQGEVDNTNNVRAVPIGINASAILSFSAATFRVNEDGTAIAPVTIERSGIITESVSVTLNLSNGTAIAGSDYNSSPRIGDIRPGETSKTVTIPIVNDSQLEADETVNLTLSNPTVGAILGTQTTAVLTIINDDLPQPGTISFNSNSYTVNENNGTASITLTRSGGSDGEVSVTLTPSDGTAIAESDYNNNSPITVTFANGETSKIVDFTQVNQGLSFDGIDDYVEIQNNNGVFNLVNSWTLEAWVKPIKAGTDGRSDPIIWKNSNKNLNQDTFLLAWNANNKFVTGLEQFSNNIDGNNYSVQSQSHNPNEFYHVAGVYDGNSLKIYVNGVLEGNQVIGNVTAFTGAEPFANWQYFKFNSW